ncbi:hypothetical protein GIB67_041373 [Kingdonia uniflora]|uniref:Uncharacterized protein n=1 Tax=Kingdonia uniflora TaxID=39325 RepID=A0A7J7LRK9_9MAGN|nr:hypothetical protein GIB67_041373 [Kingdonia uniflora]
MAETVSSSRKVVDKTLGTAANLVKLLPGGTVLAFQALVPTFSNYGTCHISNKYLTSILLVILALSCFFFTFTDSFTGVDGKLYFGIATCKSFYIFNSDEAEVGETNLRMVNPSKYRIRSVDVVHAVFSSLVFLVLAFSDSGVQNCFFPNDGVNGKQLLVNLPLGIGFMASIVFVLFPTSRKSIGYSDSNVFAS